jgi:sortase A
MKKAVSYLLICAGLVMAAVGIKSIWESRQQESQAEQQWDRDAGAQLAVSDLGHRATKGALLARLSIKRLKSKWVVIEGADDAQLRRGPGHLIESAYPGAFGNCVIAGHRDTQFNVLRNVKIGEHITLERGGRRFVYRVVKRSIIAPTDIDPLKPTVEPTLTLVTCYPFYYVGTAPNRFVVRAELISSTRLRA